MKTAKSAESSTPRLDAARGQMAGAFGAVERGRKYSDATANLLRLETAFSEHSTALGILKMRASRLESTARLYVEREGGICMDGDVTAVAKEIVAGGNLRDVVSAARLSLDKTIYRALRFPEADDLTAIKEIDFERACVLVLGHAIKLQKAAVLATRSQAISELSRSLAGERATTARQLLTLLKNLNERAEEDRSLAHDLDPAELELLQPRPFPVRILSPEASSWFLECVREGLIEAAEISDLES